jgi:hypothetical protein
MFFAKTAKAAANTKIPAREIKFMSLSRV